MSEIFSSSNDVLLNQHISSINSSIPSYMYCLITTPGSLIYTTLFIINIIVLLPLCIFILHHGVQEWQKRHSTSSASMSHSDCFTYHMVVMEMIGVFGCIICCCGIYRKDFIIINAGFIPFTLNYYGQTLFHALTCVERYLAVVHPITYLSLRQERGIRIRNITIGCVWLLCFGFMVLPVLNDDVSLTIGSCVMALTLAVISFCSLSVLWALIRPGPGEQAGNRKRVDQSKYRAFYTIVVILVTLVLRFTWCLIWAGNYTSGGDNECVMVTSNFWFYLPSSLVLPLLLLHRAGRLKCCQKNTQ